MNEKNKKIFIYAVIAIIVIIIFSVSNYFYKQKKRDEALRSQNLTLHSCSASGFTKNVSRGESTTFEILLDASRFWRSYRVKMGNLPNGVTAEVDDYKGRGQGKAKINIDVGNNTSPASYSLVIVYEEEQEGDFRPTYCQFNLIVE